MMNSIIYGGKNKLEKSITLVKNKFKLSYKTEFSLEKRKKESKTIMDKYPDRLPIIVERANTCGDIDFIQKRKYLAPNCLTMGQFLYVIRKRLILPPEKALFLFIGNSVLCPTASSLGEIYHNYSDKDGFLYMTYSSENTFG